MYNASTQFIICHRGTCMGGI
ncbi:Sec-independent protein translocase protein TatA, partial [Enterobacter cloacae complex sp. 742-ADZ3-9B]